MVDIYEQMNIDQTRQFNLNTDQLRRFFTDLNTAFEKLDYFEYCQLFNKDRDTSAFEYASIRSLLHDLNRIDPEKLITLALWGKETNR